MVKRSLYIYGLLAFKSFFVKLSKKLITLGFKVLTKYCVKQNLSTMQPTILRAVFLAKN